MLERIFFKDGRLRPLLRVLVYMAAVLVADVALAFLVSAAYAVALGRSALFYRPPVWIDELTTFVAVVGMALVLRRYLDRRSIESLGITFRTRWIRLFVLGLMLGAGMQLLVIAIELALGYTRVVSIGFSGAVGHSLLGWGALFLIAALTEEMPLRGYILQNLWEEFGFWPAALLTSAGFALLHIHNPYFATHPWVATLDIAADGIWACLAVLWTRSLWLPWAAHFAWNFFEGPVLGAHVSGYLIGPSIVVQQVSGPALLVGGDFGPEAGLVVLIAEIAGLGALYALYRFGAFGQLPETRESYARTNESEALRPRSSSTP